MTFCDRFQIELVGRGRATAVCQCGWRSSAALAPAVAAGHWEDHARLRPYLDAARP